MPEPLAAKPIHFGELATFDLESASSYYVVAQSSSRRTSTSRCCSLSAKRRVPLSFTCARLPTRHPLVGEQRQLDAVETGGTFAELVNHPDVLTDELDTLHRFDNEWEAEASLQREGDSAAVDAYDEHGRIHGHADEQTAIAAVSDAAFAGITDRRDVLAMAPTKNRLDDQYRWAIESSTRSTPP